ncbi:cell division protein ZapE [Plasticicumulans acidivorans]|uniref:Cell division protein ZapE n=2 Tax=Plasticicumulans acidivorans TaxID=886464 RepID=A0A317MZW0_9GAMM|nr:cell division protein ZapE [Plasticicumulans acidivorans]
MPHTLWRRTIRCFEPVSPVTQITFMPLAHYRQDLARPGFIHDPAQENAIRHLQRLRDEIVATPVAAPVPHKSSGGLFGRLLGRTHDTDSPRQQIKGLYFWGGVGRGKTYLVDTFFEALPIQEKQRLHFHRFMQMVHARLKDVKHQQDPLKIVAEQLAANTRVLCLDEFFVSDITDAMLLYGLLAALFERGVVLVTTTNIPPDDLYKNGLQRARFLPAIELLKDHCEILNVDGGTDYRLRYLERARTYHTPLDAAAEQALAESFTMLAPEAGKPNARLEVEGRLIRTRLLADGVVWFDFPEICDGPRSQNDYIEIARQFHTVLISRVPVLDWTLDNQARRFLNLVDEFYDRSVNLFISAEAPCETLYRGEKLKFEYQRTVSRLEEMQSKEYLAAPHLP